MILIISLSGNLFAQLRVDPYGRIGIGTNWPNPDFKCHIKGDLLLTTYPEIPPPNQSYCSFFFKVGNGWPGAEFGAKNESSAIAVWASGWGFQTLIAQDFVSMSDSNYKANIQPIENGLQSILKLKSYSFQFKHDSIVDPKTSFGFLAQEVQNILPDLIDTAKNVMLMNYQQIIPIVVEAMQEQQKIIDSLKYEINLKRPKLFSSNEAFYQQRIDSIILELNEIKNQVNNCCEQKQAQVSETDQHPVIFSSLLFQNKPNPYSNKTTIEFEIVGQFSNASIIIFNMQGTLIKTIPISKKRKGQITINGYELAAGMYLYSLIVDDKEVDTKRMILIK